MLISIWRILEMIIKEATTQTELFMCMQVRGRVFIDEQHVSSAEEIDEEDRTCRHFIAIIDGNPVATMRAIKHDTYTKLGRICVLREYRKQHIGETLVNYVMQDIKGEFHLGAQLQAIGFYERLGFTCYGEEFMDANIPHRMMKKEVI